MGTSQSAVARIESGEADVKLSTLERYAEAIGARFAWNVGKAHRRELPVEDPGAQSLHDQARAGPDKPPSLPRP